MVDPTGPTCFQMIHRCIHECIQKHRLHPWSESSPINKASEERSKIHNFVKRLKSSNIQQSLVCVDNHLIKGEYS